MSTTTVNDLIDELEEDDNPDFDIAFEPPEVREETDEDSDDEDSNEAPRARTAHLTGRQLRARARAVRAESDDSGEEKEIDTSAEEATSRKGRRRGVTFADVKWKKMSPSHGQCRCSPRQIIQGIVI